LKYPEEEEQKAVAQYLDILGFKWFHVPNGGWRSKVEAVILKLLGVKKGVPDVWIVTPPFIVDNPHVPQGWFTGSGGARGVVIEMKPCHKPGTKKRYPTKEQKEWLEYLRSISWVAGVAWGADEAIDVIERVYRLGRYK
jgi:hypothetical protein